MAQEPGGGGASSQDGFTALQGRAHTSDPGRFPKLAWVNMRKSPKSSQ